MYRITNKRIKNRKEMYIKDSFQLYMRTYKMGNVGLNQIIQFQNFKSFKLSLSILSIQQIH